MRRLWYGDCRRERCVRPGRSRTGTRSSVLPTVRSNWRFQNPADRCLDIFWEDFPRTGWFRRAGFGTIPDVDERRGDQASIERQCPVQLQDCAQLPWPQIAENLPEYPKRDGSIYGHLRLNQWPMDCQCPQAGLTANCFFPFERSNRWDEWAVGTPHRSPWMRCKATSPRIPPMSHVDPVPLSKSGERLRTKSRTSPSRGPR